MLTPRQKKLVVKEHAIHDKDTGSAPIQVGLVSKRINDLAAHLKSHPKDNHSRRGLIKMVGKRRRLLSYLSETDPKAHAALIKKMGLTK